MSVSPEREGVLALPGLSPASLGVVVSVTLVDTSALLASSSETTALAVLVDWLDDPVDAGIAADGLVLRVDEDDLEVFVGPIPYSVSSHSLYFDQNSGTYESWLTQ